jgi:hypothetical protein
LTIDSVDGIGGIATSGDVFVSGVGLTVNSGINVGANTVRLQTSAGISQGFLGTITAGAVAVSNSGTAAVSLASSNSFGAFAATSSAAASISVTDSVSGGMTIGSVAAGGTLPAINGITTTNGTITIGSSTGVTVNQPILSGGAAVTIDADNQAINQSVNAGTAIVTLSPYNGNRAINLGAKPGGVLGLTNGDLSQITASVLRISNTASSGLTVSAAITAPLGWNALALLSSGPITETGSLAVANLRVQSSNSSITLIGANAVSTVAVQNFFANTGPVAVVSTLPLTTGTVDGFSGVSAQSADILLSGAGISVTQPIIAVNLRLLTSAGVSESGSGTISATGIGVRNTGSGSISLPLSNSFQTFAATGAGEIVANAGGQPLTVGTITADSTGTFTPLSGITTSNSDVELYTSMFGSVAATQPINVGTGTVRVTGDGGFTESGSGAITAAALGVYINNNTVTLDGANNFATFAAAMGTFGSVVSINDAGHDLTIGTVGADSAGLFASVSGVTVSFFPSMTVSAQSLSVTQPIVVGIGNPVRFVTTNGVTQSGSGTITGNLGIRNSGSGNVSLTLGNSLGTVAIAQTVVAGTVSINDTAAATIGTIAADAQSLFSATSGITTAGADILFTETSAIAINQPLNAGTGIVRLVTAGGISESGAGGVTASALGVINTFSGSVALPQANNVGVFATSNSVNGGAITFVNGTTALTIDSVSADASGAFAATSGITAIGSGGVTLSSGALSITQPISDATGTVRLVAAGNVSQSGMGIITAATLGVRHSTAGAVNLNLANVGPTQFAATSSLSGASITFTSAQAVTVATVSSNTQFSTTTGIITSGGGNVILSSGALTITQTINAGPGTVTINSAGGESELGGSITAATLAITNSGSLNVSLGVGNSVGSLSITNTVGNVSFTNAQSLAVTGISALNTSGTVSVTTTGAGHSLSTSGTVSAGTSSGSATLTSSGILTLGGDVAATTVTLSSVGGTSQSAGVITAAGSLGATNTTSGDIVLTQSNLIPSFHATNAVGNVSFMTGQSLTITGITALSTTGTVSVRTTGAGHTLTANSAISAGTTSGSVSLLSAATLTLTANVTGATVLLSSVGGMSQTNGAITAATSATATNATSGNIALAQANQAAAFTAANPVGNVTFLDNRTLVVTGITTLSTSGIITVTTTGAGHNLSTSGVISGGANSGSATLMSAGTVTLGANITAATMAINSVGGSSQSASAIVSGGSLDTTNTGSGDVVLTQTNLVVSFHATNTVGNVSFVNGQSLTVTGITAQSASGVATVTTTNAGNDLSTTGTITAGTTSGAVTLTSTGTLALGTITAATVTLNSVGGVNQTSGLITASGALSATNASSGDIRLTAINQIASLSATNSVGNVVLRDGRSLTITGITALVNTGTVSVTTTGAGSNLTNSGTISAGVTSGSATLTSAGTLTVSASLTAATVTLSSVGGMSQGGAITAATLTATNATSGDITLGQTNFVALLAATNPVGNVAFSDSQSLTVTGVTALSTTGTAILTVSGAGHNLATSGAISGGTTSGSVVFTSAGTLTLGANVSAATVASSSVGGTNQTGGVITAATSAGATNTTSGDITLTQANLAAAFSATNLVGNVAFSNGQSLAVTGISALGTTGTVSVTTIGAGSNLSTTGAISAGTTSGSATLASAGTSTLGASVTAATVTLSSIGGTSQTAGVLTATTAGTTNTSSGNITLNQANLVNSFSATNLIGNVAFTNGQTLSVTGITALSTTGTVSVTTTGVGSNLSTSGAISAGTTSGSVTLTSAGTLSLGANVTGATVTLSSVGGMTQTASLVSAASAGATNSGNGNITLSQPNSVASFSAMNTVGNVAFTDGQTLVIAGIIAQSTSGTVTITTTSAGSNLSTSGAISAGASSGSVTLTSAGTLALGADVTAATVTLSSAGGTSQTSGVITATTAGATNTTSGNITLNQANLVNSLSATNTVGNVAFTNGQALAVSGITALSTTGTVAVTTIGAGSNLSTGGAINAGLASGSVTLTSAGSLILAASISSATVTLNSATGASQTAGAISAATVGATNTTSGDITLNQPNLAGSFSATAFVGNVAFTNGQTLVVTGVTTLSTSGNVNLTTVGTGSILSISGLISANATSGSIAIASSDVLILAANVTAATVTLSSATGTNQTAGVITAAGISAANSTSGDIALGQTNSTAAFSATNLAGNVSFANGQLLAIGAAGITTSGGNIAIFAPILSINQPIAVGTGSVSLTTTAAGVTNTLAASITAASTTWTATAPSNLSVGGVSRLTDDEAFALIDKFRSKANGLEPLGGRIPVKGDGLGTVAIVETPGRKFFGVNSSLLSDASKDLGRDFFQVMKSKGLLEGASAYGNGAAQVLTHAEAIALMRAWKFNGGKLGSEVTLFVDRYTCANCRKYLVEVMEAMGIKKLTIVTKSGEQIVL